ncbi:MAG: homoserine dehydrogenase [Candidatus Altiarchaeota archaeon]|nr:homoserine dehydrogenase [Candidatus Altiarchaeota archaeon]
MKTVKVALLGFGVIGRGFADLLLKKQDFLRKKHNLEIKVVGIGEYNGCLVNDKGVDLKTALDLREKGQWLDKHKDWKKITGKELLEKTDAEVAVEVVPSNIKTGEPGADLIEAALKNGRHVVSSDKCAMAHKFTKLKKLAESKDVRLLYEASAGGAMPLMSLARECLQIDEIKSLQGILNGTTNYILTKMQKGGMDLQTALREAQELGYAEADPTYDIEGIDAAAKLVILANDLMGMEKTYNDVEVSGITQVTKEAVALAKKNGYSIKLIAEISGSSLSVRPKLVPEGHPLDIDGSLNGVMFKTDVARDVTIIGRGAGGLETQSAIYSDLLRVSAIV